MSETPAPALRRTTPWWLIVAATVPHLVSQFRNRRETFAVTNWSIPEVRTMHYMTALMTHKARLKLRAMLTATEATPVGAGARRPGGYTR